MKKRIKISVVVGLLAVSLVTYFGSQRSVEPILEPVVVLSQVQPQPAEDTSAVVQIEGSVTSSL